MTTEGEHTPLSAEQADALLELLINDEQFRECFCNDLPAALARIGYTGSTEDLVCLRPTRLAEPEQLLAARAALREALSSQTAQAAMYVPFRLEAGLMTLQDRHKDR